MSVFVMRGLPALTGGAKCKTYKHCALGWDLRLTQTKSSIEGTLPEEDRQRPTQVRHDEPGDMRRGNTGKGVIEGPRDRNRGIGERS